MWHWAHATKKHCDPWWENETDWHRSWKACFPLSWHEQIHFDTSGEKHIADVKTPAGLVIEFQNSPMSPDELSSREYFYQNMIWIINGATFADRFHVLGRLPRPDASWVDDIFFHPQRRDLHGRGFSRKAESQVNSMSKIQLRIDSDYIGHHFFDWVRPHSVWLASKMPVYIDFGGDLLWQLQRYGTSDTHCVRAARKESLVLAYGGAYSATGSIVTLPGRKQLPYMKSQDQDCEILLDKLY